MLKQKQLFYLVDEFSKMNKEYLSFVMVPLTYNTGSIWLEFRTYCHDY